MDHIVWLDAESNELENLIKGNKSMIIRGAEDRKFLQENIKEGDKLYFINKTGEREVEARGLVSSVFYSEGLSVEESFETIIRHQDKLQLPDIQFEKYAGKKHLLLIGLNHIEAITPFKIEISKSHLNDDWLTVGKIPEYNRENVIHKVYFIGCTKDEDSHSMIRLSGSGQ
jgi:hypothetical protein